jgi:hypothetical protein
VDVGDLNAQSQHLLGETEKAQDLPKANVEFTTLFTPCIFIELLTRKVPTVMHKFTICDTKSLSLRHVAVAYIPPSSGRGTSISVE